MLLRSEPFREFDRITEEMLSERRERPIPVDAYPSRQRFSSTSPAWMPASSA